MRRFDLNWPTLIFLVGLIGFFALFLFYPLWYAFVQSAGGGWQVYVCVLRIDGDESGLSGIYSQ